MQIEFESQPQIRVGGSKTSPIRILHVDDDSSLLEISKLMLFDIDVNFEIDHACCVDDGLCKLACGVYDVVISDYDMPQKNGLQFLIELREQKNEIPFILFTGKGREEVAIKALNLGADGYHNKQGSPETVYGELAHNIRQCVGHNKAKQNLIKSETKYSYLFSNMLNGFAYCKMIYDEENKPIDFVYLEVNDAFTKLTGLKKEDVIGKKVTEAIPGIKKTNPEIFEIYGRVALTGKEEQFEIFFIPIKIWLSVTAYSPEKGYFIALFDNVTDRKKTQESLHQSLITYQSLINGMNDTAWVIDFSGNFLEVNNAAIKVLGYTREELLTIGIKGIDSYLSREQVEKLISDLPVSQKQVFETVHTTKDGVKIPVEISSSLITYQGKQAILSVARNIAERKQAEVKLQDSEAKLRAVLDATPFPVALVDTNDDEIIFWSRSALKLFGHVAPTAKEWYEIAYPDPVYRQDVINQWKPAVEQARRTDQWVNAGEYNVTCHDGSVRICELYVALLTDLLIVTFNDISERKIAKRELQESEERYRSLFKQAPLPVAITAINGSFLEANLAMQTFTGRSLEELKKISVESLYQNQQDRKKLIEILEREGAVSDFYTLFKEKNNNFVNVVLNVSKFQIGEDSFLRTTIQDVSERVKAEETMNQIMDQLVSVNEKLGVVGNLTRHDVRNKLSVVIGIAYLLKKKYVDKADIVDGLSKIEQAVKDSMKIFDFAKLYEQIGMQELTCVDVEKALDEAVALFSGPMPKIINDCQGLTVLADSFLRQLFYNFIDNTRKYGKKTSFIRVHYEKTGSEDLQLIYEDNGEGISPENKLKLFSEGFSTGGSTGFGLFFIRKMMDVYGWSIQEAGESGKGARFIITIQGKNKFETANRNENYCE